MIQDCLDLVLLFTLNNIQWGLNIDNSWGVKLITEYGGSQQGHMEDWVDLPAGGKR
jgi:hypothetical protein